MEVSSLLLPRRYPGVTQVARLGGQRLHPLSHLTGPLFSSNLWVLPTSALQEVVEVKRLCLSLGDSKQGSTTESLPQPLTREFGTPIVVLIYVPTLDSSSS